MMDDNSDDVDAGKVLYNKSFYRLLQETTTVNFYERLVWL